MPGDMLKLLSRICLSLLILVLLSFHQLQPAHAQTIITSTPNAEGAIIHVVQAGESLIGIAEAYGVSVDEIKSLNNLDSDEIFAGDTLIIHPASTATPTATATSTATDTPEPTTTRRPTRTPTATPRSSGSPSLSGDDRANQANGEDKPVDRLGNVLLGAMITLGIVGVVMMVVGNRMRRQIHPDGS